MNDDDLAEKIAEALDLELDGGTVEELNVYVPYASGASAEVKTKVELSGQLIALDEDGLDVEKHVEPEMSIREIRKKLGAVVHEAGNALTTEEWVAASEALRILDELHVNDKDPRGGSDE